MGTGGRNMEQEEFAADDGIIDVETRAEFDTAADVGEEETQSMISKLIENTDSSPILSGGDVDAAWEDSAVGEESVGGENPTPDQRVVEDLGVAMGLTYEDNEPLGGEQKLEKRDRDRWELDPASSEDRER